MLRHSTIMHTKPRSALQHNPYTLCAANSKHHPQPVKTRRTPFRELLLAPTVLHRMNVTAVMSSKKWPSSRNPPNNSSRPACTVVQCPVRTGGRSLPGK
mmetsp:Transcript_69587/g.190994  ORF Transcript_69587/g.190994 Transcript_69587/m.190994 type:complete len:99 (+) Transcript_69587:199-495(+)